MVSLNSTCARQEGMLTLASGAAPHAQRRLLPPALPCPARTACAAGRGDPPTHPVTLSPAHPPTHRVLRHHPDLRAQRRLRHVCYVLAVNQHRARLRGDPRGQGDGDVPGSCCRPGAWAAAGPTRRPLACKAFRERCFQSPTYSPTPPGYQPEGRKSGRADAGWRTCLREAEGQVWVGWRGARGA